MPEEQQSQGGVMFQLKVDSEVFEIRAPRDQPILDALQADTRLKKIKKRLPKMYLRPYGNPPPVKGIPNLGSPCSVIEDGSFEAKLQKGKDQILNLYGKDELQFSERHKFYLDLKDTKNKWLTKENPNKFDCEILIDCLPNDTLLKALYRDARINNDRLRETKLTTQTGDVNVKLTDKCHRHQDTTFNCKVGYDLQVSEKDWEKVCAVQNDKDRSCQTMSKCPDVAMSGQQAEVATSGPDTGSGSPHAETQEVIVYKKIIHRSQTQVAQLLQLDFETKPQSNKKSSAEKKRKDKLDEFVKPFRQDFYNANEGISVLMVEKLVKLAPSVGLLVKNNRPRGTCFRLGSRYVLTNRHVTERADMVGMCSANDIAFVNFNYKESGDYDYNKQSLVEHDLFKFKVVRVVCSSLSDELDYSLLELDILNDQFDKLPPGLGHLIESPGAGTLVTIIGHPDGRPKEVDTSCPIIGPKHSITVYLKFHPERCADYAMAYNPNRDNYKSAFGHGSSGSPGFDHDGKLVVMHACGYHLYDGSKTEVQQGVRMTAIKEDLKKYLDEDVWQDLFLPPTENMEVE
ncbi:serine protease FAM111A-like [Branchiostoma lanceolatum]|uniref:serine protease FAM111A-like n=1 Tax=Branchiostoma lanceolatum TaxID=7740 RepID=UPI0034542802